MVSVPKVPGVPTLRSYTAASIVLVTTDLIRSFIGPFFSRWGIYRNGIRVIDADCTVSLEFRQDYSIMDYPVEDGGFQSYNKVNTPSDVRCRFATGGSEIDRRAFIDSIERVMSDTLLYDVLSPEKVYIGYNFSHIDYNRNAKSGAGLLPIDVWLREIRVTATATFPNTQQPGIAGAQSLGDVQPQAPSANITQSVSGSAGIT